jgi:hypothetical protein
VVLGGVASAFDTLAEIATALGTKVIAPATNTASRVPRWNGANSKTLSDGLDVGTGANMLVQLDAAAKLPAVDGSQLTNTGPRTGAVQLTYATVADPGWIMHTEGSIGNALSGATTYANANAAALFALFWNNVPSLGVQDSAGTIVARGASAAADFAANRRILLPQMFGRSIAVAGAGIALTPRGLGTVAGAETETPTVAKTASHQHGPGAAQTYLNGDGVQLTGVSGGTAAWWATNASAATAATGSGVPLNIVDPTTYMNVMIKL